MRARIMNSARPLPKPWIEAIHPYVPGKSRAADGRELIKLSANENPLGTSPKAMAARTDAVIPSLYPDGDSNALRAALGENEVVARPNGQRENDPLQFASGALTGVWAEENTREAIFAALARKETFATSGTRIRVRMFGGWDFTPAMLKTNAWIKAAYARGAAMGGDLPSGSGAPTFAVQAMKDPTGAALDRIQVINDRLYINGKIVPRVRKGDAMVECPQSFMPYTKVPQYRETLPNGVSYLTADCTPYGPYDNTGVFTVPAGPYEPAHDPSLEPVKILPNVAWRLSTDEAIVVFGCTPPQSRYFALTHYVVGTHAREHRARTCTHTQAGQQPCTRRVC